MYLYMYLYPFITSFWLFLEIFSDPSLFFYRGLLIFLSDKFGFLSLYYILLYTILVLFDIWLPFDLYITSPACTSHYYVDGNLSLNLFLQLFSPCLRYMLSYTASFYFLSSVNGFLIEIFILTAFVFQNFILSLWVLLFTHSVPFSISCKAALVVMNCFNFCFSVRLFCLLF